MILKVTDRNIQHFSKRQGTIQDLKINDELVPIYLKVSCVTYAYRKRKEKSTFSIFRCVKYFNKSEKNYAEYSINDKYIQTFLKKNN